MARGPGPGLSGAQPAALERPATMMPGELARHDSVRPAAMTVAVAAMLTRRQRVPARSLLRALGPGGHQSEASRAARAVSV